MTAWVSRLVCVMWHGTCRGWTSGVDRNDIVGRGESPGCCSITLKSTLRPSMRGGVPVFRRSTRRGNARRRSASALAGASPARPPG